MTPRSTDTTPLLARYTPADLASLEDGARARIDEDRPWEELARVVAWDILYRKEPELYDRLIAGEPIHPDVLASIPSASRCVEVAAGTGRLTAHLVTVCDEVIAIEPAAGLRSILAARLPGVDVREGYFDAIGLPDAWADLVISCSAFTTDPAHGGDRALQELDRVLAPGGTLLFVWPSDVGWLEDRGFSYASFPGDMSVRFTSLDEALELASIFYPQAVETIAARGSADVPFELLGMQPPRDLAWRVKR